MDNGVSALTTLPGGDVVAGGSFTAAGGVAANRIARWNGAAWSALGSGINGPVYALTALPNGDVIAGGQFTAAGGTGASYVARWNGVSWSALGTGLGGGPPPFSQGIVRALMTLPNGDVIAGGDFTTAGGASASRIARWNGASWSALGTGVDGFLASIQALTTLPNGDLIAGGLFATAGGTSASCIARWDGVAWSPLGTGMNDSVLALLTLPNGDVLAAGSFTTAGGVSANGIARWDGASWSASGSGMAALPGVFPLVSALAIRPQGEVIAGGRFFSAGGAVSAFFARLATTCPATVAAVGTGCPSSGGNNTLVATTLPWVDATFHATGTGLPPVAIVVAVTSVTPIPQGAAPLAALLPPLGQPGCDALVLPDIVEALLTSTGSATSTLFLPNTPPLVGVTFYHQMVPIELDGAANWVAITATNSLQLTAGTL